MQIFGGHCLGSTGMQPSNALVQAAKCLRFMIKAHRVQDVDP